MIHLDHVNLMVEDVSAASAFFVEYLGCKENADYSSDDIRVLSDEGGLFINLMRGDNLAYPATFHIGFDAKSEWNVSALYERIRSGGFSAKKPKKAWGSFTFQIKCPGGDFWIEVACDVSPR